MPVALDSMSTVPMVTVPLFASSMPAPLAPDTVTSPSSTTALAFESKTPAPVAPATVIVSKLSVPAPPTATRSTPPPDAVAETVPKLRPPPPIATSLIETSPPAPACETLSPTGHRQRPGTDPGQIERSTGTGDGEGEIGQRRRSCRAAIDETQTAARTEQHRVG